MKNYPMTLEDIKDLSVLIVGDLVLNGLVKDCTDTDDEIEFEFQDVIIETLCQKFKVKDDKQGEMMSNEMSLKEAKKYIKEYCKYNCEVSSWAVEGVISAKEARNLTDKDTIINLAEDLQYQVICEARFQI